MRLHLFYFVLCFILLSCQSDKYHWKNQDDRMVLMSGKTVVGELNPSVTKGMNRTDQIEMLDSCTFKITCQYTALEDMETATFRLLQRKQLGTGKRTQRCTAKREMANLFLPQHTYSRSNLLGRNTVCRCHVERRPPE